MNNKKGFTLIELLIVTAIISILAAVAIPQFYPFKTRAYDADAQSNLRNVFHACKGFWTFNSSNSPCVLATVADNEYGFNQSAAVEVTIESNANNTESDFFATASHNWSSNIFVIDFRGVISNTIGGGGGGNNGGNNGNAGGGGGNNGGNNGNGGGGGGNNGGNNGNAGGCSEEAQNGPPPLDKTPREAAVKLYR